MNILFTLNKNYVPVLKNCIKSITRFNESKYTFFIMHSDIPQNIQESIINEFPKEEFNFLYMDKTLFDDFPKNKRYPQEMYYRILAADFLPETIDKILYLDPDTIVIKPLDELYNIDLGENYFAACTHTKKFLTEFNRIRLGMDENAPYINSGVMLMNIKELRKHQNREELIDYIEEKVNVFMLPDQDIISALYGDKILLIDEYKYNLSDRMITFHNSNPKNKKIDLPWVKNNTVIIHYFGKNKPWNENYKGILDCFYKEMQIQ